MNKIVIEVDDNLFHQLMRFDGLDSKYILGMLHIFSERVLRCYFVKD